MGKAQNEVAVGSVAGTGAAINISIGFKPRYVKVFNYNDAGALYPTLEWWEGMPAASGLKTKSITDSGATGLKSSERITSLGISQYEGGGSVAADGFTVGADTDVNVSAETFYYMAVR